MEKAFEFNKLFIPPQDYSNLLENYQKNPIDQILIDEIRLVRQQIAEQWLRLPVSLLESTYSGEIGKIHQGILNSAIKNELLTDTEQIFVNQLKVDIARSSDDHKLINYLLAAMLYLYAYQIPLRYEVNSIPNFFLNDYAKFMLTSPTHFKIIGEVDIYYHHIEQWLNLLHTNIFNNQNSKIWQDMALGFTKNANFIPLYFTNKNLRDIYAKRGDIIKFSLLTMGYHVDYNFNYKPNLSKANNKKIKIGILKEHFSFQTETYTTIPVFEYLNREEFEIILYAINITGDQLEKYCHSRVDSLVKLPGNLPEQVQRIRADDLDIIVIATNVTAVSNAVTLMASHRLARLQLNCNSSPGTTGIQNIDYCVSGNLIEPSQNAQEHYREQLITIDGVGICFSKPIPLPAPTVRPTRQSWNKIKESIFLISGANFYKIIPELKETWAKIMANVPNSVLVLYPFGPHWSNSYPIGSFLNEIYCIFAKYGIDKSRLIIIKTLPSPMDIKECLKIADVYLDSYPYSGANSMVDALEVGLPTVVMDGNSFRSRQASALLQDLQIPDLIADSEESYIKLAIMLATNPELRQHKREEIHQKIQNNPRFLDSRAYSAQMGELFQKLFQKWQKTNADSSQFIKLVNGCINLYEIDPGDRAVLAELSLIRQHLANFWLNLAPEELERFYLGNAGKAHQMFEQSGFKNEDLTESEQLFVKELIANLAKGLNEPKAINYRLVAMLYPLNYQLVSAAEKSLLPQWLTLTT